MSQAWFHCGRCGALFQGAAGGVCPDCGEDPVVQESEIAFVEAANSALATLREPSGPAAEPGRTAGRGPGRGKTKGLAVFVVVWVLLLVGIAGLVAWVRSKDGMVEVETETFAETTAESQFNRDAYQSCYRDAVSFLRSESAESRSRFVLRPLDTLRLMASSGTRVPVLGKDEQLQIEFFEGFDSPESRAFQSAWMMPGKERIELVFVQDDDDAWKIDWQNLVRHSEEPWSLFLSGSGPSVGEFRLLARKRASATGGEGDVSRLMFLESRPWEPGKVGLSSPEIRIDPGSEVGRQLKSAFAMRKGNEGVFGTRLSDKDPKGMIRVRVVLRRSDEKDEHGEWQFTVERLLACHWMQFDELGLPEDEWLED